MVNWFEPAILLQTGLKSFVSSLFGNYADRREMQAALDIPAPGSTISNEMIQYAKMDEIWVDFISDTGDGFNPTFSIARTAAQPQLSVEENGIPKVLPRAKILILGGDQIYPTPTSEMYDQKFRIPFESASLDTGIDTDQPHMYAIPGNHDWYDGLGSFMKVFCQQRSIGIWKTLQTRSYFAIALPHNFWLWATDIQLNGDIDKPQLEYFQKVANEKMQPGDQVILCTAEPAWIYKQLYLKDTSYKKLCFFIDTYITNVKYGLKVAVVLTGDLHHYSHYCVTNGKECSNHYFTAGGGGAFLHLTHNLPKTLDEINKEENVDHEVIVQKAIFPDAGSSRNLLLKNLLFPFINRRFSALLGVFSVLFFWLLQSRFSITHDGSLLNYLNSLNFSGYLQLLLKGFINTPTLGLLTLFLLLGFYKFTDVKTRLNGAWLLGLAHGLLQCSLIYLMIWLVANNQPEITNSLAGHIIYMLELWLIGSFFGGLLMGIYLLISNFCGIHIDESSSSLASENYKNFLRMQISKEGLKIYPIGIKKVTKDWKQDEEKEKITFTGKLPVYHLIENPIHIKK